MKLDLSFLSRLFNCSFVAQVVLLAKSLAVDLGNFMSLYSFQWNSEKKDQSVYRQTNQKIPNNNFGHKISESQEGFKEDESEDSGVYEEIDLYRELSLAGTFPSCEESSVMEETYIRDIVDERNAIVVKDFERVVESRITTKSLSCTKIREKTDTTSRSTKILRSATLPKKIGKAVRNLSSELKQIDEQVDGIKCDSCPKTFKTSNKLKMHMKCHASFSCNSCDKGFRFASLLYNHMEKCEEELQYKEDIKSQSMLFQNKMKRLSLNNSSIGNLPSLV